MATYNSQGRSMDVDFNNEMEILMKAIAQNLDKLGVPTIQVLNTLTYKAWLETLKIYLSEGEQSRLLEELRYRSKLIQRANAQPSSDKVVSFLEEVTVDAIEKCIDIRNRLRDSRQYPNYAIDAETYHKINHIIDFLSKKGIRTCYEEGNFTAKNCAEWLARLQYMELLEHMSTTEHNIRIDNWMTNERAEEEVEVPEVDVDGPTTVATISSETGNLGTGEEVADEDEEVPVKATALTFGTEDQREIDNEISALRMTVVESINLFGYVTEVAIDAVKVLAMHKVYKHEHCEGWVQEEFLPAIRNKSQEVIRDQEFFIPRRMEPERKGRYKEEIETLAVECKKIILQIPTKDETLETELIKSMTNGVTNEGIIVGFVEGETNYSTYSYYVWIETYLTAAIMLAKSQGRATLGSESLPPFPIPPGVIITDKPYEPEMVERRIAREIEKGKRGTEFDGMFDEDDFDGDDDDGSIDQQKRLYDAVIKTINQVGLFTSRAIYASSALAEAEHGPVHGISDWGKIRSNLKTNAKILELEADRREVLGLNTYPGKVDKRYIRKTVEYISELGSKLASHGSPYREIHEEAQEFLKQYELDVDSINGDAETWETWVNTGLKMELARERDGLEGLSDSFFHAVRLFITQFSKWEVDTEEFREIMELIKESAPEPPESKIIDPVQTEEAHPTIEIKPIIKKEPTMNYCEEGNEQTPEEKAMVIIALQRRLATEVDKVIRFRYKETEEGGQLLPRNVALEMQSFLKYLSMDPADLTEDLMFDILRELDAYKRVLAYGVPETTGLEW